MQPLIQGLAPMGPLAGTTLGTVLPEIPPAATKAGSLPTQVPLRLCFLPAVAWGWLGAVLSLYGRWRAFGRMKLKVTCCSAHTIFKT